VREVLRLGQMPNLVGRIDSINTVVTILLANKGIYQDQNLRLAMHHAIDKGALSKAFFNGRAEVLSMWSGPGQAAYDPDFKFPFSVEKAKEHLAKSDYKSGTSPKVILGAFNGVFPNDFDLARAIVEMWKRVGIDAEVVVTEYAKWSDLFNNQKIETPTLFSWLNPTGDPNVYSGTLMDPRKRFAVWKSDDIIPKIDPLLSEIDYEKRIAGYKKLDRWIVEQGYSMPILQGANTIVHSKKLKYRPFLNGWTLPAYWDVA
jgi:peptide/nickel transport system substrate-binding protein